MKKVLNIALPVTTLLLVLVGSYWGLVLAPAEEYMGDVYRIIYVHVPSAWAAMLGFTACFVASFIYLFNSSDKADSVAEASAEVGLMFCALLLITGAVWGKPTWGVWWTWDPRLTSAAVMFFAYAGYLTLRQFVDVPEKRATWAAVVGLIVFINIPIVWFSVKWWNSLHQVQSSTKTVGELMLSALMINVVAFLLLFIWLTKLRYGLARKRVALECTEPPPLLDSTPDSTPAAVRS